MSITNKALSASRLIYCFFLGNHAYVLNRLTLNEQFYNKTSFQMQTFQELIFWIQLCCLQKSRCRSPTRPYLHPVSHANNIVSFLEVMLMLSIDLRLMNNIITKPRFKCKLFKNWSFEFSFVACRKVAVNLQAGLSYNQTAILLFLESHVYVVNGVSLNK